MPVDLSSQGTRRLAWAGPQAGAMLYDASRVGETATADLLRVQAYGDRARPVGAGGRQAAWYVSGQGWDGVLRGYRRGGMAARVSRDAYLWQGEDRTRGFREYRVLAALRAQAMRVPAPLAAGYWRQGLIYRAAILIERIPDVRPLAQALDADPVAVAEAMVRMHRAGVWHADLNAYNILLDAQSRAWLIDFDRATVGGLSAGARQGNLARLRRSLRKVAGEPGERCWQGIAQAYQAQWKNG